MKSRNSRRFHGVGVNRSVYTTVPFFLADTKEVLISLEKQGALSVDLKLNSYILANHCRKKVAGALEMGDLPLRASNTGIALARTAVERRSAQTNHLGIVDYLFRP